jgi:hypothetical protein
MGPEMSSEDKPVGHAVPFAPIRANPPFAAGGRPAGRGEAGTDDQEQPIGHHRRERGGSTGGILNLWKPLWISDCDCLDPRWSVLCSGQWWVIQSVLRG